MSEQQKQRAAKYLALDVPIAQVARLVGLSRQTIHNWLGQEDFRALIERFTTEHVALLEDILLAGEKQAAITLTELLNSENEEVRFKAATRLLDMRGMRGKPAEKLEARTLELKGDLNETLAQLLREPAVRKLLQGQSVPPLLGVVSQGPPIVAATPGESDYEVIPEEHDGTPSEIAGSSGSGEEGP